MKRFTFALALFAAPLAAQKQTAADTADYRCVMAKFDTLGWATGGGRRQKLVTAGKACATRGFTRDDSVVTPPPPPPNRPPIASFTYPTGGCVALSVCTFTSTSTDDKGIASFAWNCESGNPPCSGSTGATASTVFSVAGNYVVTLRVKDTEGDSSTVQRTIPIAAPYIPPDTTPTPPPDTTPPKPPVDSGPPAMPALPVLDVPVIARTVQVSPPMDLQAALDSAHRGDELQLSGTWTGNYVLKSCGTGWIVVTSAGTIPAAGTRVRPSDAPNLPRIQSPNTEGAIRTTSGACRWILRGLDIYGQLESTTSVAYGILKLGGGETTLAAVPRDIVVERSWIHGATMHNDTRCVVLNSANTIIRDSWISDCHASGFDSQAIEGWNGPGPFLIENNYLEGAAENIMFGGADPGIVGLIPSDITILRNHITKPLSWKGGPWSIKNLLELKSARRVLVEGNVIENAWPASQEGMAIVIKSVSGGGDVLAGTTDLTFRWNIVRNAPVGFNILGTQCVAGQVCTKLIPVARVDITHNLIDQIGAEGRGALMLFLQSFSDVRVDSNTMTHAATRGSSASFDYGPGARRLKMRGNILTAGYWGNGCVLYSGGFYGAAALNKIVGDTSWTFTGNAIVGCAQLAAKFPPGNTFPTTIPTTGGVDSVELARRTAGVVVVP